MPERTSYEPGTPSWADLGTSDPDAAKAFYGALFGWDAEDAGDPEATGGYAFFKLRGRRVAGVGPLMGEGQPTAWSTYVATDDLDALAGRAQHSGASTMVEPMAIFDAGRMAFFFHPAAGMIGAWEAGQHAGAELTQEHGSLSWSELHTRDVEGAKEFGEAVFGWVPDDQQMGGMTYTIAHLGETGVAGIMQMPPGVPDEVPAYWLTVLETDDCDATVATVRELGGQVMVDPVTMEGVGRFAYVLDPQGAMFGLITSAS